MAEITPRYVTATEAAAFLKMNLQTLRSLPLKYCATAPNAIRYDMVDLREYRERMPIPNDHQQMADLIRKLAAEYPPTGAIYFIRCRELIKIGYSRAPKTRFQQFQEVIPFELTLLGTLPGSLEGERALHKAFAHRRVGNLEWFRHTRGILKAIAIAMADKLEDEADG